MTDLPQPQRPRLLVWLLVAFLALLLGILLVSIGALSLPGVGEGELRQLAYLVIILAFVGTAFLGRSLGAGEIVRGTATWLAIFLVAITAYAYQDELSRVGGRLLGVLAPGVPISGRLAGGDVGDDDVVVVRAIDGHFSVRAGVNGASLTLMVDTGASFVTLTPGDAEAIGIDPAALQYVMSVRTANGTMNAAPITIDTLTIGGIERTRIPGLVAPPGTLDESLLGMSFLNTLHGYAISGDRMVLTP